MGQQKQKSSNARNRLLETADRLFYAEGINSVGIDRIIAEAEVAKMTLYNHFPSKDDLVLAVLQFREEQVLQMFRQSIDRHLRKKKTRIEALFDALKDWFKSPGFRGCAFINATAEIADPKHAASMFSAKHKQKFVHLVADILQEDQGRNAASLAPAIALIIEGAIVSAVIQQKSDSADIAKKAALTLLSSVKRR